MLNIEKISEYTQPKKAGFYGIIVVIPFTRGRI